ncbi:hypothetical protein [Chryseobacterium jejuense]|uniref:hypothetical protein n=1 Tax=Chryseobacterium jejuense TaxID=445960 RepID=UPI001AE52D41|nr:hypothetical protein [Chryseobacterium jejuense]MBP2619670.1 hypothetical protein [Chryseobacterium jejuense]
METKTNKEVRDILLNEFNNYLLSEKAGSWIKECTQFYFSSKKETSKVKLTVNLRNVLFGGSGFWEYKDGFRQLVTLNKNGTYTYYQLYDVWEGVNIFTAEIDIQNLNVEIIHKDSECFKTIETEKKTNEEIHHILLKEFNAYLLSEKAEFWIKEYSHFYFSLKKETQKAELSICIRKIVLEDNMFWESRDGVKQLVALKEDGTKTYYISYDVWEDMNIFSAEINLQNLNVEVTHRESRLSSFNQDDFFI